MLYLGQPSSLRPLTGTFVSNWSPTILAAILFPGGMFLKLKSDNAGNWTWAYNHIGLCLAAWCLEGTGGGVGGGGSLGVKGK